jgi:hypothetical protein
MRFVRRMRWIAVTVLVLAPMACNQYGTAFTTGFLQGLASRRSAPATPKLMLFGGPGHHVYLGCINCDEMATDSIFNEVGPHGSTFAVESIWAPYGSYGGQYSNYSPWNPYASDPPVIVDQAGNFYGYFTVNEYHSKRTTNPIALAILGTAH